MTLKEEAKTLISELFGPLNASRLDSIDDSDPKEFLSKVKEMIEVFLGSEQADEKLKDLYEKYIVE